MSAGLDLTSALVLALACFFGPAAVASVFRARRSVSLLDAGLSALVSLASFFAGSALLRGWVPYGFTFLALVIAASTAIT